MKRRALSLITALALCLSLCPVRVWAADGETGGESCPHHTEHTEECGYAAEDPGEPCTFVCRICPIEARIGALPASVSEDNWEQVQAQIEEIYDLCGGLTSEELQQVDLSACLALLEQIEGMEAEAQSTASGHSGAEDTGWTLENDHTFAAPYVVSKRYKINTSEYTLIGTGEAVIQVSGTGVLDFKGAIKSQKGVGVEVLSGGVLRISEQVNIRGQSYALSVASGGEAHLSAGTYFGKVSAIWVEDGNYAALLEEGYAYFDENGDPIQPKDMADALTVVVQQCTEHNKTYTHNENAPTHTWSCSACQLKETEKCTFTFSQDGTGEGGFCGRTIAIVVDEDALSDLVYNGTTQPEEVDVTVTLDNSGKELVRGTDYKVDIQSIKDAGQATVTVTGITFNGTFVRTYTVRQDQPGIEWDSVTCNVDYDSEGRPVDISKLPHITIKINAPDEDLHAQLEYSYRTKGTTDEFVNGLPTDAGTYEVKAYLLESQNYEAAETNPCLTLTINKINALIEAPVPTLPTYDGNSHALVTAGKIQNGAVIEYAREQNGSYTTDIPSGINAGDYTVWYRVTADPKNYNVVPETEIPDVKIKRKAINPYVTLSEYTYLYDGGEHQPKVTVKDEDDVTVILDTEYEVEYTNNRNVGTATVTVTDKSGGNYELTTVTVPFEITQRTQDTLSITQKPNTVTYGDKFTLGTTGGSGSGNVTWKITDGTDVAEVDRNSGQVTVTGHGSATVKATKSGASPVRTPDGNYEDAIALWTFTAGKKPVTAVLTVTDRDYMASDTTAKVTAAVPDSELVSGDSITITGLTGTFEDPNAGTDKKVTVNSSNSTVTGTNWENYDITYPAATTASILKAEVKDVTPPTANANLEYTSLPLTLVTGGGATGGTMEYSLDGTMYSASLPTGINAGNYDVWYRVKGDSNHNDTEGKKLDNPIVIVPQEVTSPVIEFSPSGASYDGQEHKPAVTVKDQHNRVIPNSEYTLDFGNTDWIKAGGHTVTVKDAADGNYDITQQSTTFTISPMGQNPLSIVNQPGKVQYGDSFTLSTMGGSGTGAVKWESSDQTVASISTDGLVKVLKSGSTTITATKETDGNYGAVSVNWSFSAEKKPVTPIVTAQDKEYDTDTTATLVITWKDGDLLNSDSIALNLAGTFNTPDVGTGKTVTISGTPPTDDRYSITIPTTTTASITPKAASVSGTTATELDYTGSELVLVGSSVTATNGTMAYSRDGSYFVLTPPKETNAGTYTVFYKAQASGNYKDSPVVRVDVTIKPKSVTSPVIELSGGGLKQNADGTYYCDYDGTAKRPDVVVKDGSTVIPASEYTVSYSGNTEIGQATVTISDNAGGNYTVSGSKNFTIQAGAPVLTAEPQPRTLTYNGRQQPLVTAGTAVNGHLEYALKATNGSLDYKTTIPKGTDAGIYEVWYKVVGDGSKETTPDSVIVEIMPKSVNPTVTLTLTSDPLPYTGRPQTPGVIVVVENNTLTKDTDFTLTYSNNTNVGTATVAIQSVSGSNYQFYTTRTFEIAKSQAAFSTDPVGETNLVYTGKPQKLIQADTGITQDGIVLYSTNAVTYSAEIPTGTDVGTYTIYAKVQGNSTHEDSDVKIITAQIKVNTVDKPTVTLSSNSFPYTGNEHKPTVTVTDKNGNTIPASEYTVSYSNNTNVGTGKVTITSKGTNYSFTAEVTFEIIGADQIPLTITGKQDTVYYGDTLSLGTTGGSGNGKVTWSSSDADVAGIAENTGAVTIKKSGSVTITATKAAGDGYGAATDTWTFYAKPKPVRAVVTAADKVYDGNNTATLTVTVSSGLVSGDAISGITATGHFSDENVGTNKTVVIDSVTVSENVREKYDISYPATVTASITPKPAAVSETDKPTLARSLTYTGSPQALLTSGGTAEGGNLAYSIDGGSSYSFDIPKGTDAGSYTVWYKVIASDSNHKDSTPAKLDDVTIAKNTGTPTVLCMPSTFQYDGTEKTPTVVVRDNAQRIIPESEYTVSFSPTPMIAVKTYTVTVTDKPGGNYEFTTPATGTFEIVAASQNPLSIITDKPTDLYYGDTFRLTAMGGSGSGAIHWSIAESSVATINGNGVVTVIGTGGFTVEAYREASDGYDKSNTDSVPFYAKPKPVTPGVTAKDKPYDGTTTAELIASWKPGDLVGSDTITLTVEGQFVTADVGTGKQVTINSHTETGATNKYTITWPASTTASISKVDAKLENAPVGKDLTYNGGEQDLVTGGSTEKNIGTIEYSLSQNGQYSTTIPTGKDAGKYTVWYRVAESVNYTGISAAAIEVEIKKVEPIISTNPTAANGTVGQSLSEIELSGGGAASVSGTFAWKDGSIKPGVGTSKQYVVFTPDDTANYTTVEFQIDVTIQAASGTGSGSDGSGSSTETSGPSTTVQDGTASTVLSASDGSSLVREAAASQSDRVVIKPEVTGDVTRTEVSIPASTVSRLQSETNAALTVSAPIADVTIPNQALDTLSSAGGTVNVVTEQVDQAVVLTLTAGGEKVEELPGGLTLSVPVEDAGPGTVAVLVHEDGTRETIRKSVVEDGMVNIPLNGSATVEIVDNSKEFADVPSTNWAADAVAFASAHELFSGTSENTFSPNQPMSRGMLTTVLYNLEGRPEQDLTVQDLADGYSDVSSDAWYAEGIAWAAENGIASGYANGQFGPDDSITREQFAVMLWKYAGSPGSDSQLDFTDADQISGYAQTALRWAAEKGILSGYTNDQLSPKGTATRAEAAQMLKSFLENS